MDVPINKDIEEESKSQIEIKSVSEQDQKSEKQTPLKKMEDAEKPITNKFKEIEIKKDTVV